MYSAVRYEEEVTTDTEGLPPVRPDWTISAASTRSDPFACMIQGQGCLSHGKEMGKAAASGMHICSTPGPGRGFPSDLDGDPQGK